ncbi:L-threonylcarbamoyladenylate synthase [Polyangium mundeleinium]|uniref:L-threonylcarbamoyladenylate synthase n=1 Tax=Polyangium mundeleinium TaxID=2995306 RepID=A0ABT5F3Q7_9BACT|nr:L-threonylcarbamoyladenylate synthase [Polyangium mundeleinium]MDC0748746.1 L-threonylcarbamoyladenylate synthase [Polyangium mundeleinium]
MGILLPINPEHPEPRKIRRAVEILEKGGVIGYPTDTVYGLGCDLFNKQAIETLYQIKGMQRDKNLAFICPDLGDIARYAIVENAAYRVLKRFLPGPYCFVLQATREVPKIVQMNKKTVGIRVPSHPVTLAIVRELGRPIISTTAAPPGEDPMVDPWEIKERFPALELILDAGAGGNLPTTVIDLSEGDVRILREGAGPIDELV